MISSLEPESFFHISVTSRKAILNFLLTFEELLILSDIDLGLEELIEHTPLQELSSHPQAPYYQNIKALAELFSWPSRNTGSLASNPLLDYLSNLASELTSSHYGQAYRRLGEFSQKTVQVRQAYSAIQKHSPYTFEHLENLERSCQQCRDENNKVKAFESMLFHLEQLEGDLYNLVARQLKKWPTNSILLNWGFQYSNSLHLIRIDRLKEKHRDLQKAALEFVLSPLTHAQVATSGALALQFLFHLEEWLLSPEELQSDQAFIDHLEAEAEFIASELLLDLENSIPEGTYTPKSTNVLTLSLHKINSALLDPTLDLTPLLACLESRLIAIKLLLPHTHPHKKRVVQQLELTIENLEEGKLEDAHQTLIELQKRDSSNELKT